MSKDKTEYTCEFTGNDQQMHDTYVDVREWLGTLPCVIIGEREDGDFEIIASTSDDHKDGTIVPRINK